MANLSESDRKNLSKNPNVLNVSGSNVNYSPQFKLKAVKDYLDGISPKRIFEDAGIDLTLFNDEYPKFSLARWRKIFDKFGADGFKKERRGSKATGRPAKKFKSTEEELNYLRSELDLLKKLHALAKKSQK